MTLQLGLDTSTPVCKLVLIQDGEHRSVQWQADRGLADGLLGFIRDELHKSELSWGDIQGIVVFRGPGSFTGLRIGLTVMNTLADSLSIPIVGESGEDWLKKALFRLNNGESDGLVMPSYGRGANITKPRK